jgi:hypothetical protein
MNSAGQTSALRHMKKFMCRLFGHRWADSHEGFWNIDYLYLVGSKNLDPVGIVATNKCTRCTEVVTTKTMLV